MPSIQTPLDRGPPELPAAPPSAAPAGEPGWLRETPFWAVSALLHLILVLLLLNILVTGASEPERRDIVVRLPEQEARPYDPTPPKHIREQPPIPDPEKVPLPVIPVDPVLEPEFSGDPDHWTNKSLSDLTGADSVIGVQGLLASARGFRQGEGNLYELGGSEHTQISVRAALEWLRRHQSADGGWKAHGFTETCTRTCRNLDPSHGDGRGFGEHDVGVTALAMLAYTGFGNTHQHGIYRETLKRAARYLRGVQVMGSADPAEKGRYGPGQHEQWIYDHALATLAMAELVVMTADFELKRSVEAAVELCLHARNRGFGWRYGIQPGNNDTSVTGWMVLALKMAKSARLDIPRQRFDEAFQGALNWFDRATSTSTGKTGYQVPGDEGSRLARGHPEPYPYSKELSCMSAVGVLCRLFSGESRARAPIKRGVDILLRHLPRWAEREGQRLSTINMYYWYYGSYALFHFGGTPWKRWNEKMQRALVPKLGGAQRQGGCEDGSWDPIGEWGIAGGRVYSTALGAMTLEVYYRYERGTGEL